MEMKMKMGVLHHPAHLWTIARSPGPLLASELHSCSSLLVGGRLLRIDYFRNFILVASAASILIALTYRGTRYE